MTQTPYSNHASTTEFFDPLNTTLIALFEQYVAQRPEDSAFIDHQREYTYTTLNTDANHIAHHILQQIGEAPSNVVMLLENGYSFARCFVGTRKAIKTLVPLEGNAPPAFLEGVIRSVEAPLILTDDTCHETALQLQERIPGIAVINTTSLPEDSPTDNPGLHQNPREVAFIMHTSGSTGVPKGVLRNEASLLIAAHYELQHGNVIATDRLTSFSSFSFGAGFGQIIRATAMGVPLCHYNVRLLGTTGLKDWIDRVQPAGLRLRPTLFRSFTASLPEGTTFNSVRYVHLGGEQAYKSDFDLFRQFFPKNAILKTVLGSTETGSLFRNTFAHDAIVPDGPLSPGSVHDLTSIQIVDDDGNPQPTGVAGNIVCEGVTTAVGYWGEPDNATTRFEIIDRDRNLVRLWTNDRGVFHEDGTFEFLGRSDDHVKIRGYRVQLKAVEAALLQVPDLNSVAVIVRKNPEDTLVAHYATRSGSSIAVDTIRSAMAENVPDYMIPSYFFHMTDLPMTPSGKVDRRALPEVDLTQRQQTSPLKMPTSAVEARLVSFYAEVLGISEVSIDDGFFNLGGTSLQASQLMSRIKDEFGVELPLVTLMRKDTPKFIAGYVNNPDFVEWTVDTKLVTIKQGGDSLPIVYVHGKGGRILGTRKLLQYLDDERPFLAIQDEKRELVQGNRTAREVGEWYARLVHETMPQGPYIFMGYSVGGAYAYEMALALERMGIATGDDIMLILLDTMIWDAGSRRSHILRRRLFHVLYTLFPNHRVRVRRTYQQFVNWTKRVRGKKVGKMRLYTRNENSFLQHEEPFNGEMIYIRTTISPNGKSIPQTVLEERMKYWRTVTRNRLTVVDVPAVHKSLLGTEEAMDIAMATILPRIAAFNDRKQG